MCEHLKGYIYLPGSGLGFVCLFFKFYIPRLEPDHLFVSFKTWSTNCVFVAKYPANNLNIFCHVLHSHYIGISLLRF